MSCKHAAMLVIDDEETLMLEEVSRSKMLAKQNDPISKEKKVNTTPINYVELNKLSKDFVEAPSELPKVSLVNASLKKLKFYLAKFDSVVKIRTSPDATIEDVLLSVMNSTTLIGDSMNLEMQRSESYDKCFDLDGTSCDNQNALEILKYFKNNDLKAQLQAKDTRVCKLKEHIKSMRENDKEEKFKHDMDEIETINIELEHSVAKLLYENEHLRKEIDHLKHIFKDQFDSIKKTRVRNKEHSESLILQLNSKSVENTDLKAQIQDKEILVYVRDTCSNAYKPSEKLIIVTPVDKVKKVRFSEPVTSSSNIKQITAYRITPTKVLSIKESTPHSVETQKPYLKVYSRKPKKMIHLLLLLSMTGCPDSSLLGNVTISRVYYVEGLGHNSFSVGQFCDEDLEVAFQKNTCFIRNLEGVDLLSGSKDTNLYTISLDDMLNTSLICLLSKASKTKSWLWHRRLSYLNFGTRNKLAKDGLA
ncbi:hypothetical protein Tco_0211620 [Tanacetum coccineum]